MTTPTRYAIVPAELLRLVADGLKGSPVRAEQADMESDSPYLVLTGIGVGRSTLRVNAGGTDIRWEYSPFVPGNQGKMPPREAADIITSLLTGEDGPYPRLGDVYGHPGITYTAMVGRELNKRGLSVELNPARDDLFYMVLAAIDVTGPDPSALVTVSDEGYFSWGRDYIEVNSEYDFWYDGYEPVPGAGGGGPAVSGLIARAVTKTLIQATRA